VRRLWHTSPELIVTAALMVVVLTGALIGLAVDASVISGAPAWLKPAKFALSITIYTVTLAWIFTLIPEWTRTHRVVGWTTAITMVIEISIITTQAWRGKTSHFNVGTIVDGVLFAIMGLAILIQTLSTIAVAVALWRHRFEDGALGWALRFGMCMTIAGALTGGLMTRPTATQLEAARAGERMTIAGAHTVGAPDGGAGLMGTGWSTEHGDLRVPHFVGLHALQVLAVIALLLARLRLPRDVRVRLVLITAASYAALYGILLNQALRGLPLAAPDATTLTQLGIWVLATTVAAGAALRGGAGAVRRTARSEVW
jgi:hypothetical protein